MACRQSQTLTRGLGTGRPRGTRWGGRREGVMTQARSEIQRELREHMSSGAPGWPTERAAVPAAPNLHGAVVVCRTLDPVPRPRYGTKACSTCMTILSPLTSCFLSRALAMSSHFLASVFCRHRLSLLALSLHFSTC